MWATYTPTNTCKHFKTTFIGRVNYFLKLNFLFSWCVCVCVYTRNRTCEEATGQLTGINSLLPCESWELNSSHQALQQAPLLSELSHQPRQFLSYNSMILKLYSWLLYTGSLLCLAQTLSLRNNQQSSLAATMYVKAVGMRKWPEVVELCRLLCRVKEDRRKIEWLRKDGLPPASGQLSLPCFWAVGMS